ncbi:MAG: prepilin-type N-terminal cleavage/methylation domain-containing protein [Phycisphaerae bacterium]|jgi:prepilin-type N-terminal cleavage/methylation domain-containing protein|nr:prepilin-type N-terminal cleavage/methylation domain-containing protein [Phycisphaerae bacterium]
MTCIAQTHTDSAIRTKCDLRNTQYATRNTRLGFSMAELLVVLVVVSLFTSLAQLHLFGLLRKNKFRAQIQELVSTMQMAGRAAAESDRRYEVIIDIAEQSYLLREITNPDLSEVLEEEIIVQADLGENCRLVYVEFDDATYTNEGRAKFRAGRSGWAYGGKIVLMDRTEQPYSLVVNRLNRIVELEEGDVSLLQTKAKDDIPF